MSHDTVENAFTAAMDAFRAFEAMPTNDNRQTYYELRGKYRVAVIDHMEALLLEQLNLYNRAAARIVDVWEQIAVLDRWFKENKIDSRLPRGFVAEVNLPAVTSRGQRWVCGREARPMPFPFEETFTAQGRALWDDLLDPYRMPPDPPRNTSHRNRAGGAIGR